MLDAGGGGSLPLDNWAQREIAKKPKKRGGHGAIPKPKKRVADIVAWNQVEHAEAFMKDADKRNRQRDVVQAKLKSDREMWLRHQDVLEKRAKAVMADMVAAENRRAMADIENAVVYFSDAPLQMKRAEPGFHTPSINDVLMLRQSGEPVFNPTNPRQVRFIQNWAQKQGASVKLTGVWDEQTYAGVQQASRLAQEKSVTEATKFVETELIGRGYLKPVMGLTARQIASAALTPEGGFAAKSAFQAAFLRWMNAQKLGIGQLKDYQDAYVRTLTGVPWLPVPEELRYVVGLPTQLQMGVSGEEANRLLEQMQKGRVPGRFANQTLQGQREEAAEDTSWWKTGPMEALQGVCEALNWVWVQTRTAGLMMGPIQGIKADLRGEDTFKPYSYGEAKAVGEEWAREYWWADMLLSIPLDPMNYVGGTGFVGKAAKFLRQTDRYARGLSYADDGTRMARAMGLLDTSLAGVSKLENFQVVRPAVKWVGGKSVYILRSSPAGDVFRRLGHRLDDFRAYAGMKAETARILARQDERWMKALNFGEDAKPREGTGKLTDRAANIDMDDATIDLGPDAARYVVDDRVSYTRSLIEEHWGRLEPLRAQTLKMRLRLTEEELLDIMAQRMGNLLSVVDNLGVRLYYDDGAYTQAGAHLSALLHGEAWDNAQRRAVAIGDIAADEMGTTHFMPTSANNIGTFVNGHLLPQYSYVEDILLPALNSHAKRMGYGVEYATGVRAQVRQMLGEAFQRMVQVRNPNWKYVVEYTDAVRQADTLTRGTRVASARATLANIQQQLDALRVERSSPTRTRFVGDVDRDIQRATRQLDLTKRELDRALSIDTAQELVQSSELMLQLAEESYVDAAQRVKWLEKLAAQEQGQMPGPLNPLRNDDEYVQRLVRENENRITMLRQDLGNVVGDSPAINRVRAHMRQEIDRLERLNQRLLNPPTTQQGIRASAADRLARAQEDLADAAQHLKAMKAEVRAVRSQVRYSPLSALGFNSTHMESAIEEEAGRWVAHYQRLWETQARQGLSIPTEAEQKAILQGIHRDIRNAWRRQGGAWRDTRQFVDVPAMYVRGGEAEPFADMALAESLGLAAGPALRREMRGFFEGVQVTKQSNGVVSRLTARAKSLVPDRNVDGAPEQLGSEFGSPVRQARVRERSVHRTRGAYGDDYDRFAAALAARREVLDETTQHARVMLYGKYGMFLRAMAHHEDLQLRLAYRGFAAASTVWRTAVLPLRMGWAVRNVCDNFVKTFISGLRDPRRFFDGATGRSIFELVPVHGLKFVVKAMDNATGTNASQHLDNILAHFADLEDATLAKILGLHDIPIPSEVTQGTFSRFLMSEEEGGIATKGLDWLWSIMGDRPEQAFRKAIYRDAYLKELKLTGNELWAEHNAIKEVNKHLFDYGDYTVLEEQLKAVVPFLIFWKNNVPYWFNRLQDTPWVLNSFAIYEHNRDAAHEGQPSWMQRYLPMSSIADAVSTLPGGDWLAQGLMEAAGDPLQLISGASLYRLWKEGNPTLADEGDMNWFQDMISKMEDTGMGLNPFFRRPLELTGVLQPELWRHAFPQTDVIQMFSREWWPERFPNGIDVEALMTDWIWEAMGQQTQGEFQMEAWENIVEMEMARQVEAGALTPSREDAEEKMAQALAVRGLVGYMLGFYTRQQSPEDMALYTALSQDIETGFVNSGEFFEEHPGYSLFRQALKDKKLGASDLTTFSKWAEIKCVYDAYLDTPYKDRPQFLMDNPEVAPYVIAALQVKQPATKLMATVKLQQEREQARAALDALYDVPDAVLSYDDKAYLASFAGSPGVQAEWARHRTPEKEQRLLLQAGMQGQFDAMQQAFFAIPTGDYSAQQAFLQQNPLLVWYWNRGHKPVWKMGAALRRTANASLRTMYFRLMDAGGRDKKLGYDFLKAHPFIFEGTDSQDNVTIDGQWIPKTMRGSQEARESLEEWMLHNPFEAAQVQFWTHFYSLPEAEREGFVREWGVQYGFEPYTQAHGAQLAADTLASIRKRWQPGREQLELFESVKPFIDEYASLLNAEARKKYLKAHPLLQEYMNLYGRARGGHGARNGWRHYGNLEHVRAYMKVQRQLRDYFRLPEEERDAFLAKHPELQEYFAKWGQESPPGSHAAEYMAIKPLLDEYFSLPVGREREVFWAKHPELQRYFDKWVRVSEDSGLGRILDEYHRLPKYSRARSDYIKAHPELQHYFYEKASPETRHMMDLLDVMFSLRGTARRTFEALHPEVMAWLEERRATKAAVEQARYEYDMAQPFLRDVYQRYADIYLPEAENVRKLLAGHPLEKVLMRRERSQQGRKVGAWQG